MNLTVAVWIAVPIVFIGLVIYVYWSAPPISKDSQDEQG